MLRVLIAAAPLAACTVPTYPVPPRRTAAQIRAIAEKDVQARAFSEAARPHVLEFFAAPAFRAALRECCPAALEVSPEELLVWWRAEVQAAEYAHAFPLTKGSSVTRGYHFSVELGEKYKFLLNSYQSKIALGAGTAVDGLFSSPAADVIVGSSGKMPDVASWAEEQIFGLPPFANASQPTWAEASDRFSYVAQNMRRLNFGSAPFYGDATVIFNNDYIKDMVLAAPMDTGSWEMFCNMSWPSPSGLKPNCTAWVPQTVGTWNHFDHLLLDNLNYWRLPEGNSTAKSTLYEEVQKLFGRSPFARNYSAVPNVTGLDVLKYWESNVVGNVRFPEGVRFLIGSFSIFGTKQGRSLQRFAINFGWPLVWALTWFDDQGGSNMSFRLVDRVLDPTVPGSKALNATLRPGAGADFEELWTTVHAAKAANATTDGRIVEWWQELLAGQVAVAPSTARLCGRFQQCIGYELRTERCLCQQGDGSTAIIV